jgi:hypothetical protein
MRLLGKTAIAIGLTGAMALGSVTASQARVRPWVAGAAGFAVGAAIGSAAANASYYGPNYSYGGYYGPDYDYRPHYGYAYQPSYAYRNRYSSYNPTFADTSDPNSAGYNSYAYAPGYGSYAYDPGYSYSYNSNALSPWHERKLEGHDY